MSVQLQHRRGTTAQHATFTGAAGEFTMDTTKNTVVVHDGATSGGFPLARISDVQNSTLNTASAGGSANVITATFTPAITTLVSGLTVLVRAASANTTGTPTFQANATVAKTIVKGSNQLLEAGDIAGAGHWLQLTYDLTLDRWVLDNPARASIVSGRYSVTGLRGANNAGTPNTQFDLLAAMTVLRNPVTGGVIVKNNVTTLTNNIASAGPVANGRDQAGAFGASTWLHLYFICDPAGTVATLSSTAPPLTGPTLPATYTHWSYAGAVYFNASSLIVRTRFTGAYASYDNELPVLAGGTSTAETSISLTAAIPPNALNFEINMVQGPTSNASGFVNVNSILRVFTGLNFGQFPYQGYNGLASTTQGVGYAWHVSGIPNISQTLLYVHVNTTGTGSLTVSVNGYKMPNGGE